MTEITLLTKDEAATALRMSRRKIERLIASRRLPARRDGRHIRIRCADLAAYIDSLPAR